MVGRSCQLVAIVACCGCLSGCIDRIIGAFVSPAANAGATAGAVGSGVANAAAPATPPGAIDAANTAARLDRWLKDHPDAENADELRKARDRMVAQDQGMAGYRKPKRIADDPGRDADWDRRAAAEARKTWWIGGVLYSALPVERLGKVGHASDELRLDPVVADEGRPVPVDGNVRRPLSPYQALEIEPVRLGKKPVVSR